jgi:hypothetical protein
MVEIFGLQMYLLGKPADSRRRGAYWKEKKMYVSKKL